ncbi:BlaI/MecI/CopY family transcriptional regulator [Barnesiella sp. An55]|uniref:BlaI/MecI/CopY family transcriptional regulator n=1 Tax=Barnesiella sp. An55 TaxID=1965646 RepID=UPI000B39379A|nr:BlaI/MecI/CopY family transcriptional regulator [Barnesiella sp. An55]OUN73473.1 transcriptional regulator [Barnesiella sp. An55]HIZ25856.1 BlaI/MecI/CopY family transcriptional regulator [Candidatus Barnesiella merdipullorum]
MDKLTHQEEEVMLAIWEKGQGIIKDFLEKLPEPRPPYTTVASVVKNLERKGYLSSQKIGNTYLYTPHISQHEYKKKFLSGIVKSYFSDSYKEMVSFFAHENKLSEEDLRQIIEMIEREKK